VLLDWLFFYVDDGEVVMVVIYECGVCFMLFFVCRSMLEDVFLCFIGCILVD